jgi:ComF family protein
MIRYFKCNRFRCFLTYAELNVFIFLFSVYIFSGDRLKNWSFWQQSFLDLFFPPVCASCLKPVFGPTSFCDACAMEIRYLRSPFCIRCGTEFTSDRGGDHVCGTCLQNPPPFMLARGIVLYAPPVSILLHRLKYGTDRTVLSALAQVAVGFDFTDFISCDLIIPVPLYPKRLRERGLNQSLILARILFPVETKAICSDILVRTRDTVPQTSLNGKERRRNLRGAFAVKRKEDVIGKGVCLVDDVFTTGTTVCECAGTLLRAGAKEVKVLTMARVTERIMSSKMEKT